MTDGEACRPAAVVAVAEPRLEAVVAHQFRVLGHRVVIREAPSSAGACRSLLDAPAAVVVLDAAGIPAAADLTSVGGRVVVVHEETDVAGMCASYRLGASPCAVRRRDGLRVGLPLPVEPATLGGGAVALEALHHETVGRHAEACETLAHLREEEMPDAVEVLVQAGAAALDRLRGRARYPVPTSLLVDQLPAHLGPLDQDDFERWWEMVQVVAFRASGLQPPVAPGEHRERVFGAFHAAAAIVQFTARRHWRRPGELLGDLAVAR